MPLTITGGGGGGGSTSSSPARLMLCLLLEAFWMALLRAGMPGSSSPLPLLVRQRCSSPFSLTFLNTFREPGLSSTELKMCCAVECARGGVKGGVACDSALRLVIVASVTT